MVLQEVKQEREFTKKKIEMIENMPINPFERVELILIRAAFRMATTIELTSHTWKIEDGNPKRIDRGKLKIIEESLKGAGYVFKTSDPEIEEIVSIKEDIPEEEIRPEHESIAEKRERITIRIAEDQKSLDKYLEIIKSGSDEQMGKACGFPKSAIKAYLESDDDNSRIVGRKDLPEGIRKQEWSLFASFMMSRDKWREELEIVKKWAKAIDRISPKIYREYVEYMKQVDSY